METPADFGGLLSGHAAVLVEFDWPVCHRVTSLSWFARPAWRRKADEAVCWLPPVAGRANSNPRSLLPLKHGENLQPGLCLRDPSGQDCSSGILAREFGGATPMRINDVMRERLDV